MKNVYQPILFFIRGHLYSKMKMQKKINKTSVNEICNKMSRHQLADVKRDYYASNLDQNDSLT